MNKSPEDFADIRIARWPILLVIGIGTLCGDFWRLWREDRAVKRANRMEREPE